MMTLGIILTLSCVFLLWYYTFTNDLSGFHFIMVAFCSLAFA